ncbi:DUF2867 domain-containing protein [Pseudaestuariivita sp.]|uniref:DUF2867 domain-containing protein n=1 Tax=Pseudaestuariivita sp. TaxID=2211669 RepID=UPI004058F73E
MSALVQTSPLPEFSALHALRVPRDFLDCYAVASSATPRQAAEVITAFPRWTHGLLTLRKLITAPFGLKQEGPDTGNSVGPFPVTHESATELTAGFDDRHLDFRVSVTAIDGTVRLATWVKPHNFGGRAYLTAIMPFHIAIARNALARTAAAFPP